MKTYRNEQLPRPLLGIIPEKIHTEHRVIDLLECMIRSVVSNGTCKREWLEELGRKIVLRDTNFLQEMHEQTIQDKKERNA